MQKYIVLIVAILSIQGALARYDETLPKGVRTLIVRQVKADNVTNMLNLQGQSEAYGMAYSLDIKSLGNVEMLQGPLDYLKENSPEVYENLELGTFDFNVKAKADVTGFGFGYGISDRLTFYGIIPYYKATVDVGQKQLRGNNYDQINEIQNENFTGEGLKIDYSSINLDINDKFIQSAIQDFYGYEALGVWSASGIGDIELGLKYRFLEWGNGGALVTLGSILPTGREDNPDIIQDFGFGTGHTQVFTELGVGHTYKRSDFSLWGRVDYSFSEEKQLRPSTTASDLTDEKGRFIVTPGVRLQLSPEYEYYLSDWFSLFTLALFEKKFQGEYESENEYYNDKLAAVSGFSATTLTAGITFSTVKPFMKKEFVAPMKFTLRVDSTVAGRNVTELTLYSAEMRLFF